MAIIIDYTSGATTPNPMELGEIIRRAGLILQDEDHVRWEVGEIVLWINDAAREIVSRKRSARAVTVAVALEEGSYQVLPERTVMLMDVMRNLGMSGGVPGRAIRRVDRQLMDDQVPGWHMGKKSATIKHFMFEERAPTTFYVYPPALASTRVECLISQIPPHVTESNELVDLSSEYMNLILSFVVYRALSKDSEYANGTVAALHYQSFLEGVEDSAGKITANSPNVNSV